MENNSEMWATIRLLLVSIQKIAKQESRLLFFTEKRSKGKWTGKNC